MKMENFSTRDSETRRYIQRFDCDEVQHRNSQSLKLAEKLFFRRCKLVEKKHDTLSLVRAVRDAETQTLEPWSHDTCMSKSQVQNSNRIGICTTSDEIEKEKSKPIAKSLKSSKAEKINGIRSSLKRYRYENCMKDVRSLILCAHGSPDSSGAPNDAYECLFDIVKGRGEVPAMKHPAATRRCNGCTDCKAIHCDRIFANTCLQTDLTRYQIAVSDSIRADLLATKCNNDVEGNVSGTADIKPAKLSVEKSKEASLRVKKKITLSIMRGTKLMAVKGSSRRRKKVAKVNKKKEKKISDEKKDSNNGNRTPRKNDDEQYEPVTAQAKNVEKLKKSHVIFEDERSAVSTPSDDYTASSISDPIGKVIPEPDLTISWSERRGMRPTKSNHFSKNQLETGSTLRPNTVRPVRKNPRLVKKKPVIKTADENAPQLHRAITPNNTEWESSLRESEKNLDVIVKQKERSGKTNARKMQRKRESDVASTNNKNESTTSVKKSSRTIRHKDDSPPRSSSNERVSFRRRGRQIPRGKQMSSVLAIWQWLRRRHCSDSTAVSTSAKLRTPSFCIESSGHDAKDPFLSLFFPLSITGGQSAVKINDNLPQLIKARDDAMMYKKQTQRRS